MLHWNTGISLNTYNMFDFINFNMKLNPKVDNSSSKP